MNRLFKKGVANSQLTWKKAHWIDSSTLNSWIDATLWHTRNTYSWQFWSWVLFTVNFSFIMFSYSPRGIMADVDVVNSWQIQVLASCSWGNARGNVNKWKIKEHYKKDLLSCRKLWSGSWWPEGVAASGGASCSTFPPRSWCWPAAVGSVDQKITKCMPC